MQKDVAEKYGMNREIIRRIWNRIMVPTDDIQFMTKKIKSVEKSDIVCPDYDNLTH